jgi:hypothetical protein
VGVVIAVVVFVVVVGMTAMARRLWRLNRAAVRLHTIIDDQASIVDDHRLQEHVGRLCGESTCRVGEWVRRADEAVTRAAERQRQFEQRLDAVERSVRWARQAQQ